MDIYFLQVYFGSIIPKKSRIQVNFQILFGTSIQFAKIYNEVTKLLKWKGKWMKTRMILLKNNPVLNLDATFKKEIIEIKKSSADSKNYTHHLRYSKAIKTVK